MHAKLEIGRLCSDLPSQHGGHSGTHECLIAYRVTDQRIFDTGHVRRREQGVNDRALQLDGLLVADAVGVVHLLQAVMEIRRSRHTHDREAVAAQR